MNIVFELEKLSFLHVKFGCLFLILLDYRETNKNIWYTK